MQHACVDSRDKPGHDAGGHRPEICAEHGVARRFDGRLMRIKGSRAAAGRKGAEGEDVRQRQ